jgi:starvation-inducible outer membrane lipoprotein
VGDYRIFFSNFGSIIIRMVGIYSSSILAEEGVTVYGNVEDKEQRSVDFTSVIYNNFEKTSHEIYHIKPFKD